MKYILLILITLAPLTLHAKAYSNDNEDYLCTTNGENKTATVWVIIRRHDGHYQNSLVNVVINPCGDYIIPEEYFYAIAQMISLTDGEVKYKAEDEPDITVSWDDIEQVKKDLAITTTAKLKYQIFLQPNIQSWNKVYKINIEKKMINPIPNGNTEIKMDELSHDKNQGLN